MSSSTNPTIQKLMDEVNMLDDNDELLETKLQKIAEAVAKEQQKGRTRIASVSVDIPTDPSEAFACDGCQ